MRLTVVALAAILVASCGRYEGPVQPEVSHHEASDHPAPETALNLKRTITLKVVVRDVVPLDFYDDQCRLMEPVPRLFHELEVKAFDDSGDLGQTKTFAVPAVAQKVQGAWCESPPVTVRIAEADRYSAFVASEGQGILDESQPIYPHSFSAWDGATVYVSE